eukprot:662840-Prorocentrum_minimum.AAC.1
MLYNDCRRSRQFYGSSACRGFTVLGAGKGGLQGLHEQGMEKMRADMRAHDLRVASESVDCSLPRVR